MTDGRYAAWLSEVIEAYALDDRAQVSPLRGGTSNVSFTLGGLQSVIITFCVELSVPRAERLARLIGHLGSHGFPTNRIVPSQVGDLVHVVDGVPVIVKAFIAGQALRSVDNARAHRIGGVLARLHRVPAPDDLAPDHSITRATMTELAETAQDGNFSGWLLPALQEFPANWGPIPAGIVHGDLVPDNLVEAPDGSLVAIDFEEACLAPFVFDVGMSLLGLGHARSLTIETASSLLAGYQVERELEASERKLVPTMVEYSAAMTACWRYELGQRKGPLPGELRDWRDMQTIHGQSQEWRRSGVWSTLLDT